MGIQTSKGSEISSVTLGQTSSGSPATRNHRENIETVPP